MIEPSDERRPPITPQLAVRVAILGGVALALFGIVFFRLWFLQVLSGDQYLAQAQVNRVRSVPIAAPRGEITDRNGKPLVTNKRAVSITVTPSKLPQSTAARERLLARLSRVVGDTTKPKPCDVAGDKTPRMPIDCLVRRGENELPYADVTVKTAVPRPVYTYIAERAQEFPGISYQQVFLRSYPFADVGAQLFGMIGQADPKNLKDPHYRGAKAGTLVGKTGLEYTYDQYLRGRDGAERVQVDALGRAKGALRERAPVPGSDLRLSLDMKLEQAGQNALQEGIDLAGQNGNPAAAGAFVALDPRNGEVLAMGSAPSFDPNKLVKPLTKPQYNAVVGAQLGYPQINRAIAALYPVGSTFKVITSVAALVAGVVTPGFVYDDTGEFRQGALVRQNAGHASYGPVDLTQALDYSVDTYFYRLGALLNEPPDSHPNGGQLQAWAHKLGLGRQTGIDIGGELGGLVPTPRWRDRQNRTQAKCEAEYRKDPKQAKKDYSAGCVFADGTNRPWTIGDNSNLAVGQGDFLATPLQMAVAYATIENGGTVVKPHIGLDITDNVGRILQKINPKPARHVEIPQGDLDAIRTGLHLAASDPNGGTSADVFAGFPKPVYGKTGTAQHTGQPDQAWYVAYVPDPVKPIVVACTIEKGGFGAQSAAPAVRLILSQWFGIPKKVVAGKSTTL